MHQFSMETGQQRRTPQKRRFRMALLFLDILSQGLKLVCGGRVTTCGRNASTILQSSNSNPIMSGDDEPPYESGLWYQAAVEPDLDDHGWSCDSGGSSAASDEQQYDDFLDESASTSWRNHPEIIRDLSPRLAIQKRTTYVDDKLVSFQVRRCCHYPFCENRFKQLRASQLTCATCVRSHSHHENMFQRLINRVDERNIRRCSGCELGATTRAYGLRLDGTGDTWTQWGQRHYKIETRCSHPGCKRTFEKELDGHSMCVPCSLESASYMGLADSGEFIGCCNSCKAHTACSAFEPCTEHGVPLSRLPQGGWGCNGGRPVTVHGLHGEW